MAYQVLARKWRPRHFEQIVGQKHTVQALTNALQCQYLHHAYLFTGTRGVGKTTLARLLVKCLNCIQGITAAPCDQCSNCQEISAGRFIDLYEIDAASRTKVDDTRELLDNVPYAPSKGRFKVYLIDEVHMLSGHSFNALLKTLEEPPSHVKFLLATTDPQKLPATILSRCLQFHLLTIPVEQISEHLQYILKEEKISFEPAAILLLSQAAHGSMRDALSLLDQSIAYGNGQVLTQDVKLMLGIIDHDLLMAILKAIKQQNANNLFASIEQLNLLGIDFSRALADLLGILHQIAVRQWVNQSPLPVAKEINELAQQMDPEEVQLYYQIGLIGQRDLTFAPTPRMGFEMTLLRMLAFMPQQPAQKQSIVSSSLEDVQNSIDADAIKQLNSTHDWHKLLPNLNLQGTALLLAQHCQLHQRNETKIELLLNNKHKPFLQDKHLQRIKTALQLYFSKNIELTINCVNEEIETSALIAQKEKDQRYQTAICNLENDPFVQRLKQQFDAKLLKDSLSFV